MMRVVVLCVVAAAFSVPQVRADARRWTPPTVDAAEALARSDASLWRERLRDGAVLLGVGPDGRERLKARIASSDPALAALRAQLLGSARGWLQKPIPAYRSPEEFTADGETLLGAQQELWMRPLGDALVLLSVAAAIEDDAAIRARIHDLVLALCRYPRWGAAPWAINQDLPAGHVARGIAFAWSWHRDLWDAEESAFILEVVASRVDQLARAGCGGVYWSGAYQENHLHVSMAGAGYCGVAFLNDLPDKAPFWLAVAELNFKEVGAYAYADGSSPEGVPYWSYGASFILQYIEAVRGIVDTDAYYGGEWLRSMVAYRLHASTPGFAGTLPWGDAPSRDYYGPQHILNRLASEYHDSSAQYLSDNIPFNPGGGGDVLAWTWLWRDPSVPATPAARLDYHTKDIDIVGTRTGWGKSDYLLSIKSGFTNRTHSHLDAGALAFAFGDDWLITAPGYGTGKFDGDFWKAGGPRWTYASNATESNSTLVINGSNQRFDLDARGTIRHFASSPGAAWAEVDLGEAYAGVTSAWRRVFHRRGDYILVFDDVGLREPGRVEWLLQVPPSARLQNGSVVIQGKGGSLVARILDEDAPFAPRAPLSPKLDVPPERLKTYATVKQGGTASFRALLTPHFAGESMPEPVVTRVADKHYRVQGGGWGDEVVFLDDSAKEWSDVSGDVSVRARMAAVRHADGELADVIAVESRSFALPFLARVEFAAPASAVSATRIRPGLWVLAGAAGGRTEAAPPAGWKLYSVTGDKMDEIRASGGLLPEGAVLAARGDAKIGDYLDWEKRRGASHAQPRLLVRAPEVLPPAGKGSVIRVEAETGFSEESGRVSIVDKPGNRGRSLSGFGGESPLHRLTWKVRVEQPGSYRVGLRYCTEAEDARVALLLDGAAPSSGALALPLPATGGWSVRQNDWKDHVLAGDDGELLLLPLTAGEHEISLTQAPCSLNLDAIDFVGGGN